MSNASADTDSFAAENAAIERQVERVAEHKSTQQEADNRYRDLITAFLMLIVVLAVQYSFGIDSVLTALAGILAGAVAMYFGLNTMGKIRHGKQGGKEEVPVGDRWRR